MRTVIQWMAQASATVDRELLGRVGKGFLILLGVADGDTRQTAERMVGRICRLRILEDEDRKANLPLENMEDEPLVISQLTLYADYHEGNRSSSIKAGALQMAKSLYKYLTEKCRTYVSVVEKGRFGADMKMELLSDGPFTLILDSQELSGE